MTSSQYWDEDCQLVVAFRKAEEYRTQRRDSEMWVQGEYILLAIANALNGNKSPYPKKPFSYTEQARKATAVEDKYAKMNSLKAIVNAWATESNAKRKETQ